MAVKNGVRRGISLPVIGIGLLAEAASPGVADLVFAAVIAVLALVALTVEIRVSAGHYRTAER